MSPMFLVADFEEDGVVEFKEGKLYVSGIDVDQAVYGKWGGVKQRGHVEVKIYLKPQATTETSPDMG